MNFRIIGPVTHVRTFAAGRGIRDIGRLRRTYGRASWRKRKGVALVELPSGALRRVELHWYEAVGIGRREFKIKHFID